MESNEKQLLRKRHKELRAQMSASEVKDKSKEICNRFLKSSWYLETKRIFGYYPLGNEVDCLLVLRQALSDGKRVALPRTEADCRMDFYEITSIEQVEEGAFHVMEPQKGCQLVLPSKKAEENRNSMEEVVLVPGVVFDKMGNRYGYGKGYYDRYFARFPQIERIAFAYENQLEDEIETLITDVKMHSIYTEQTAYRRSDDFYAMVSGKRR